MLPKSGSAEGTGASDKHTCLLILSGGVTHVSSYNTQVHRLVVAIGGHPTLLLHAEAGGCWVLETYQRRLRHLTSV